MHYLKVKKKLNIKTQSRALEAVRTAAGVLQNNVILVISFALLMLRMATASGALLLWTPGRVDLLNWSNPAGKDPARHLQGY